MALKKQHYIIWNKIMNIEALKKSYHDEKISKPEYIESAYNNYHKTLFEYASHLKNVDIKEITIDGNGVIFTIRSSGVKIHCQIGDHRSPPIETFNFSDFEPAESRMMEKLFEGKKTFYDIGANIGWHSITLSSRFRNSIFHCFEPIPATYQELTKNINLNSLSNITTHNIAISDTNANHNFYYYQSCSGNASAVNLTKRSDIDIIECQQVTLDHFSEHQNLPPPDFIKCDVEGAELMVFKGAGKTLKKHKPIVMAEILRKWSKQYNYNPNEIFSLFAEIGYRAFTTNGMNLFPFQEMTEQTIQTNFFFLHNVSHLALIRRLEIT